MRYYGNQNLFIMKTYYVLLLAAIIVAAPSCKNQNKKEKQVSAPETIEQTEISNSEKMIAEDLAINMEKLLESVKKTKGVLPFVKQGTTNVQLTDKEKMVKPDYLFDPADVDDLQTLVQKYRVFSILSIDKEIARLYGMPTDAYDAAIAKILAEVNDPALKSYVEKVNAGEEAGNLLDEFMTKSYKEGRANLYWEAVSAMLVETVFVASRNVNKFIGIFDDQSASDVIYNFICVHEGINSLIQYHPEMESLNEVLEPLYVINAINVQQLKDQLTELKGEIQVVRSVLVNY